MNMNSFSLKGKTAWITGASYGIGFAIAEAYAAAGATIVFNDINQELVDKGLKAYAEKGIDAKGYVCDVTSEDAVIAFSFPRYSTSTVKGVQYCHSVGAKVIGITNSNLSPLAQISDCVLVAKSDMVSLVDSLVAPLSVVNALIVALAAGREQELSKTFDTLEKVWEEYHVYEKRVDTHEV